MHMVVCCKQFSRIAPTACIVVVNITPENSYMYIYCLEIHVSFYFVSKSPGRPLCMAPQDIEDIQQNRFHVLSTLQRFPGVMYTTIQASFATSVVYLT